MNQLEDVYNTKNNHQLHCNNQGNIRFSKSVSSPPALWSKLLILLFSCRSLKFILLKVQRRIDNYTWMRWQGVWIWSKIASSSCFLLTGQMERQVASMADAFFSPHLLMAAASVAAAATCREEVTMEGWTWHTGTRTRVYVCVCVQVFVSMGVPKSVDASVGLWINHHITFV